MTDLLRAGRVLYVGTCFIRHPVGLGADSASWKPLKDLVLVEA